MKRCEKKQILHHLPPSVRYIILQSYQPRIFVARSTRALKNSSANKKGSKKKNKVVVFEKRRCSFLLKVIIITENNKK